MEIEQPQPDNEQQEVAEVPMSFSIFTCPGDDIPSNVRAKILDIEKRILELLNKASEYQSKVESLDVYRQIPHLPSKSRNSKKTNPVRFVNGLGGDEADQSSNVTSFNQSRRRVSPNPKLLIKALENSRANPRARFVSPRRQKNLARSGSADSNGDDNDMESRANGKRKNLSVKDSHETSSNILLGLFDFKTRLSRCLQHQRKVEKSQLVVYPTYSLVQVAGTTLNKPLFVATVLVEGRKFSGGEYTTRKAAEQSAAQRAILVLFPEAFEP